MHLKQGLPISPAENAANCASNRKSNLRICRYVVLHLQLIEHIEIGV
jgi:hypothetical protein